MKHLWFLLLALTLAAPAALAATDSIVLVDPAHPETIHLDFGQTFADINRVEVAMTSEIGQMYICGNDMGGDYQYPSGGTLARFDLGDASMLVDVQGTLAGVSWDTWEDFEGNPVANYAWLEDGVADLFFRLFGVTSPNWDEWENWCYPPAPCQIDEIVITVHYGTVPDQDSSWGRVKAIFR